MWCPSFNQFIGIITVLVGAIAAISAFFREEFLARLEGNRPLGRRTKHGDKAWWLCIVFCILFVFVLIWALICLLLSIPVRELPKRKLIDSTPTIPSPTSTPTVGELELNGDVWIYPPVTVDGNAYRLYVFVNSYNWIIGTEDIEKNKKPLSEQELIQVFKSIHADMREQDALIAVGTASSSVQVDNSGEENRADNRADKLVDLLRFYLGELNKGEKSPALWKLNIGRCRIEPDSDMQRPLVVVGVTQSNPSDQPLTFPRTEVELEALRNKLEEKGFKFPFSNYTMFELFSAS